jgi:hypothetical protein
MKINLAEKKNENQTLRLNFILSKPTKDRSSVHVEIFLT